MNASNQESPKVLELPVTVTVEASSPSPLAVDAEATSESSGTSSHDPPVKGSIDQTTATRPLLLRATPWPERNLPFEGQLENFTARFTAKSGTTEIVAEMKLYDMNLCVECFNLTGAVPASDECEKWLDFMARRDYSEPPKPILDLHNELMDAIESLNSTTTITAPFAGGYPIGGFRTWFSSGENLVLEGVAAGKKWFPYQVPAPSWLGPGNKIQPYSYSPKVYGGVIQRHIDKRIQPLEGFSSLNHRSRAPRHEWIQCAVAAELAIKDFISRRNSVAAVILERVPSPPVHEMYGRVLKQIIKEESPVAKELGWGAAIRNHLVHRVGAVPPTNRQVFMYKYIIELALYHLMKHLYPDVEEIDFEYSDRLAHLNEGRNNKKDDDPKRPNFYLAWRRSLKAMYDIG
jgi:hypothetical protein